MRVFWTRVPDLAPYSLCDCRQLLPSVSGSDADFQVSGTLERIEGKRFISCCPKRKFRGESEKGRRKGCPREGNARGPVQFKTDLYPIPFSLFIHFLSVHLLQPCFFVTPTSSKTRGSWVGF